MKSQLILTFALLLIGAGAALAQTPDELPPSRETVCDAETGAAYGLCNAYCEAMDCESEAPSASATACDKVSTKFQTITGHALPCEVSCPCNIPGTTFADVVAGQVPIEACFTEPVLEFTDGIALLTGGSGVPVAGMIDTQWVCGVLPIGALPITPEQGLNCVQLLEQAANNQSVTCVPPSPPEH